MNTETSQKTDSAQKLGVATGSAPSSVITSPLTGVKLQLLNRQRMLKTGDKLSNKHGQFLWEVIAFHPEGVRVIEPMTGICKDWKWETIYTFYERAEEPVQNKTDQTAGENPA